MSEERELAASLAAHSQYLRDCMAQAWRSHAPKSTVLLNNPERPVEIADALNRAWFSWLDNGRDVASVRALAAEEVRKGLIYSNAAMLARSFTEALAEVLKDQPQAASALKLAQQFTAIFVDQVATLQELRALQERERLAQHLQASAEAGRAVAATRDMDELMRQIVNLLADRFGYLFAGIYTFNAGDTVASLREASGKIGEDLKNRRHSWPLDGVSPVATAARTRQACLKHQADDAARWMPNSRSEVALPLLAGQMVLGVLDVHALEADAFDNVSVTLLENIADQLAMALDNARLLEQSQTALNEARRTQQLLSTLIDSLPSPVFFKDTNGAYLGCNRAFEVYTGRPRAEIVGRTVFDTTTPELAQRHHAKDRELLENPGVQVYESTVPYADGTLHNVVYNKATFADAQGQPAGLVGVIVDVTERKQAEESLLKFRRAIEQSTDAVFMTDLDGKIVYVNPAFEQVYGYSAAEAIGQTPRILKSGMIPPERYAEFWKTLLSGQVVAGEIINKAKNGRLVAVEGSNIPIIDDNGATVGFVAVHRDITARKQTEEAARRYQAQLAEALRIARLANWEYDVASDTFTFNDQFYALLRTTAEAEGGYTMPSARYAQRFVHPDDAPIVGEEIRRALETTDPTYSRQIDHRILYADGQPGFFSVHFYIEKDAAGRTVKTFGANQDITDRKRAEEALRRNEEQLLEALRIAHLGYWEYDVASDTFTFNNQFYSLLHTTAQAEGGYLMRSATYAQRFVHPQDASLVGEEIGRALASTDPDYHRQIDHRILYADGGEGFITVRFRVERDAAGHPIKFVGANEDITERKRAEARLQELLNDVQRSERLMRSVIDATPDWIFIKDQQHRYRLVNQGYASALHLQPEDFIGKTDLDLGFPEELVKGNPDKGIRGFWADDRLVMDTGEPQVYANDPATIDGVVHVFNTIKVPLRDIDGNIWGVLAFARDITERERLLAEQQKRALQLQTAAEVSRAAASILEPDVLIDTGAELVRERFGLYYVGIFLLDETGEWAVLRAGTGEAGRAMIAAGHKLRVGGSSMIGWCIANRQARIALDVGEEAVRFDNPLLPETRSEMALPLINRGRVMGAATIQSREARAFGPEDIAVLQTMADQLTTAVANARLFEQSQRAARELAAINEMVRAVSQEIELPRVLEAAYVAVKQIMPADAFIVALHDADSDTVSFPLIYDAGQKYNEPAGPLSPTSRIGQVIRTGEPILIHVTPDELAQVTEVPHGIGDVNRPSASLLYVAMKSGTQVLGALSVQSYDFNAYSAAHVGLLSTLANQLVTGIRNAQLFEETRRVAEELAEVNRRLTGEAWRSFMSAAGDHGVIWRSNTEDLKPLTEAEANQLAAGQIVTRPDDGDLRVSIPVMLRGQLIGALHLRVPGSRWTNDLAAMASTIAGHLAQAAENTRLLEQTERLAQRERTINEINSRVRQTIDLDSILRTAVNELGQTLRAARVVARLSMEPETVENGRGDNHE